MDAIGVGGIICASGCLFLCIAWGAVAVIRAVKNVDDPFDH